MTRYSSKSPLKSSAPVRGWWKLSKKGKKIKEFLVPNPKKKPARAGWPKRLGLVRATTRADFAVIGVEHCSTIRAIFPRVTLSWEGWFLLWIIVDYCQPQKRNPIWIECSSFENLVIWHPYKDVLYQRSIHSNLLPSPRPSCPGHHFVCVKPFGALARFLTRGSLLCFLFVNSTSYFPLLSAWGLFQAEIGKPGTQNPGPGQVFKLWFVPRRTQKNDMMMWRNRHICTKFQENRLVFGSTKINKSKPSSVTSNLECDVLWRKCDVTSFRHRPSLKPRSRFWENFG